MLLFEKKTPKGCHDLSGFLSFQKNVYKIKYKEYEKEHRLVIWTKATKMLHCFFHDSELPEGKILYTI